MSIVFSVFVTDDNSYVLLFLCLLSVNLCCRDKLIKFGCLPQVAESTKDVDGRTEFCGDGYEFCENK